jgi:hypothetical protein
MSADREDRRAGRPAAAAPASPRTAREPRGTGRPRPRGWLVRLSAIAATAALAVSAPTAALAKDADDSGVSVIVPTPEPPPPGGGTTNDRATADGGSTDGATGGGDARPGGGAPAVGGAAQPAPATEPALSRTPASNGEAARVDRGDSTYAVGAVVTVSADGFTAGEQVQVVLYSDPILIGNVTAGDDGTVTHAFSIPADLPPGKHTIQLTGWQSKRIATVPIIVAGAAASAAESAPGFGLPAWVWWAGGGAALALLATGGWWIVRVMRRPGPEEALT